MNIQLQKFYDNAVPAFDALRLFVVCASRTDTIFSSSVTGDGAEQQEIINFKAAQSSGKIIRNVEGLQIEILPNFSFTNTFAARRLQIPRAAYETSQLMAASPAFFALNGGKDYALAFATLAASKLPKTQLAAYEHDGAHLLVTAHEQSGHEAIQNAWQLAQSLDLTIENGSCLLRYPSFDTEGAALIMSPDGLQRPLTANLDPNAALLHLAMKSLPNALKINLVNDAYPPTYSISPLAFTLAAATDRTIALALGIGAAARVSVNSGNISFDEPSGPNDPCSEF